MNRSSDSHSVAILSVCILANSFGNPYFDL